MELIPMEVKYSKCVICIYGENICSVTSQNILIDPYNVLSHLPKEESIRYISRLPFVI